MNEMNGTVTDSSGAVVPGTTIQVGALATNLEISAQSNSDGSFSGTSPSEMKSHSPGKGSKRLFIQVS